MYTLGDCVLNQQTGDSGKVIGFGHQILDGVYLPTLIVKVFKSAGKLHSSVVEDLSSAWMQIEGR